MYYFCTYYDGNYYPRARALYASLMRHGVECTLFALCLDDESYRRTVDARQANFIPIACAELERRDTELARTRENRSTVEYYFTCTAALCLYVMENFTDVDLLTYLDADLYFFSHPQPIFDELRGASIGIIEHRYSLLASIHHKHGKYNVGWVSFRRDENGMACIRWWRERCIEWCYDRLEDGKFADQKYLEEWPDRFPGVHVIRHKGANVGSWNIANYCVKKREGEEYVDDVPLLFFHFACFSQIRPWLFNTSFGGNYVFLSPGVRRGIYTPYIEDLLRFSAGGSLAHRERRPDSHIRRAYQTIRMILRTCRGIVFGEYIIYPQSRIVTALHNE
jgi:hypothetical protein